MEKKDNHQRRFPKTLKPTKLSELSIKEVKSSVLFFIFIVLYHNL